MRHEHAASQRVMHQGHIAMPLICHRGRNSATCTGVRFGYTYGRTATPKLGGYVRV